MKCRNCEYAKKGYFQSFPNEYACIGVKEPFVIDNYPDAECLKYNNAMNDGIYMELFAIKDGMRYNVKVMNMNEAVNILTNSLLDGIEKLWQIKT